MNELRPKLFDVMKSYTKKQLIKDIISGIIVAIIALPLSIALAIASGVGPEQGLYTAIIAGFFISFFGGSRVQIGGPTAAFVVIIYGIVASYGTDGLIVATILAGIILVIMGICRFGSLIKYIPYTITTGFTCGIAVTLFIGQLKDFFGMDIASVPSEFLDKVIVYAKNISTINLTATLIGLLAVAIMLLWTKVTDKIPGSLVAIVVTTAIAYFAKLPVNTIGSVYGKLNSAFPSFHVPSITMNLIQQMISPAFTIAVLAAIESLLSAVVSDGMIGDTHKSNAELIGQGLGNIFSGFFGGIPATGAIARTAANVRNGALTGKEECIGAEETVQKSSMVYPAVVYIEEHLHEIIPMHEMASLCHLSRSYFSRLFQHDIGENYTDYVNRRKVERAKELLRSTPDSVSAIASALGFLDVSYFVKLFKRFEGVTPLTYRKLKRSSSAAPSLGKI